VAAIEGVAGEGIFLRGHIASVIPRAIGWVLDIGYWLLAIGYWILAIGYWVLGIGYWVLDWY
jgi:hypothetical protein